jgi:hypothetical protein
MANKTWVVAGAALCVVAAGAVAVALASDWGSSKGSRSKDTRGSYGSTRLIQFDADKDGRITRAEIDSGLERQFATADTNSDGKLDAVELQKYNEQRRAERKARYEAWRAKNPDAAEKSRFVDRGRDGFDPLKYSDWNRDGFVTPDEFGGKIRAQAMRADRDNDGVLLVEDLQKRRGKKGEEKEAVDK